MSLNTNAAFSVTAGVTGLEKLKQLIDLAKQTGDSASFSAKQFDILEGVLGDVSKRIGLTEDQMAGLIAQLKATGPQANASAKELNTLAQSVRAAGASAGLAPKQIDELVKKIGGIGVASGISARQTEQAFRQLPVQITDAVTQLAGGQNPFLILLQQGGQVKDSFGGIVPAARALASAITPVRLATFGLVGALGALAFAAIQGQNESSALSKAIALTGNAAGKTIGQIEAMSRAVANIGGGTIGDAKDIVGGVLASGAFGPDTFQPAAEAMASIQKLSGQTADELVKDFASMSRGVASWAAEHNRQYNYLTADQYKYIKSLEDQGRTEEAIRENVRLLNEAMSARRADLGYLEEGWNYLKKAASEAWNAMLGIGKTVTLEDQLQDALDKVNEKRQALQQKQNTNRGFADFFGLSYKPGDLENDPQLKALVAEADRLQKAIEARQKAAGDKARKLAEENRLIQRQASGELLREQQAQANLELQRLQNASEAKIALLGTELSRLEGQKKAGLITDADYSAKKLDIERRELAERIKLVDAEIALEKRRPTGSSKTDLLGKEAAIARLQGQRQKLEAEAKGLSIEASFGVKDSSFSDALNGYKSAAEKANFQAEATRRLGASISYANEEQARYDAELGKFKLLSDAQKSSLLDAARAADVAAESLRQQQAAVDYEKQTKLIEAQTRAINQGTLERQQAIALQELENRGIVQGTELYTQLAERRMEALRQQYEEQRSFVTGAKDAFRSYVEDAGNAANAARQAFSSVFNGLENAIVKAMETGKLSFKDFAREVLIEIARIQVRMAIAGLASNLLGGLFGGANPTPAGTSSLGDFSAGGSARLTAAKGAALDGGMNVTAFAKGGAFTNSVVSEPTKAPMALFGEAGPEAIMPLTRDGQGRLGVRAEVIQPPQQPTVVNVAVAPPIIKDAMRAAATGGDMTVNVTVNAETGQQQVQQQGQQQGPDLSKIGSIIAANVRQTIINEQRPGGLLFGT